MTPHTTLGWQVPDCPPVAPGHQSVDPIHSGNLGIHISGGTAEVFEHVGIHKQDCIFRPVGPSPQRLMQAIGKLSKRRTTRFAVFDGFRHR